MTALFAQIILSGPGWLAPAGLLLLVSGVILFWSYRSSRGAGAWRWVCFGLKLAGLGLLALCLLEPLWSTQRAKLGANLFAILADNSQSLQITDRGETKNRAEQLRAWLDPAKSGWQSALEGAYQTRRYCFDARLQNAKDFAELTFDGRASSLNTALHSLAERYRGRPLAGVLVFTDGNATDLGAGALDTAGLPPIYPVVVGHSDPAKDISIQQVRVSQSAFEDAPVSIQADALASGYAGEMIAAQLLDPAGKMVQTQSVRAPAGGEPLAFRFQLKPQSNGLSFYQLRLSAEQELAQFAPGGTSREATLANNTRFLAIDRGRGPYRILYVAGRPNWEFKFLNRALEEDEQLRLVGLIRVARREPKFDFRGRAGETSNPLYRGFGDQSREETERYDQPVLIRLNTRDELELRGGFPRVAEELYGYHAVIVDDVEAEFFTPEQAGLLAKFVSERGGGLLMLGGMETFQQGGYHRTPIGDMLPVYLDHVSTPAKAPKVKLNLTREGWLLPWARLRDNEADEKTRREAMPEFQVLNRVREVKPGATVVASVKDEAGEVYPALVAQRFGHGRTAALTLGDFWRWGMHDAAAHQDMDKAWRQMMRWLVTDVPERVALQAQAIPGDPNAAMRLEVRVRDAKFLPIDDAAVSLEVQPMQLGLANGTNLTRLRAEPAAGEPGLFQAAYVPHASGGYRVRAFVTNSVGAEVGRAETGWTSDLAGEEFRSLAPNRAGLEALARATGGEVVAAGDLENFARQLPLRQAPVMEACVQPLWHTPAFFALALGCLVAEWGLRRWKGLP